MNKFYQELIKDLLNEEGKDYTEWESNFVRNMDNLRRANQVLTDVQQTIIREIHKAKIGSRRGAYS